MTPTFLTHDDLVDSHAGQIANYGGTPGLRDAGLLESARMQAEAQFGGQYLHADLFEMAAAYLYYIVQDHPFVDGNKRVGLEAALVFLEINGHSLNATDDELVDLDLAHGPVARVKNRDSRVLPCTCLDILRPIDRVGRPKELQQCNWREGSLNHRYPPTRHGL